MCVAGSCGSMFRVVLLVVGCSLLVVRCCMLFVVWCVVVVCFVLRVFAIGVPYVCCLLLWLGV